MKNLPRLDSMVSHIPVLLHEAITGLKIEKGEKYIDCTLGGGGHTAEILKKGGLVLGIELDSYAIERCRYKFKSEIKKGDLKIVQANFKNIDKIIRNVGWGQTKVSGVLYDLGLSTFQLKVEKRGFSFRDDVSLDMRVDQDLQVTAEDLVRGLSKRELESLIRDFGEDPQAKRFARAIKKIVSGQDIKLTAYKLADMISKASKYEVSKIHPATRVFQALRIAVNSELENLKLSLRKAPPILKSGGRLVVISFHSLEDRIVKDFGSGAPGLKQINARPIVPSKDEVDRNPSSRSAKMRIYEKVTSV